MLWRVRETAVGMITEKVRTSAAGTGYRPKSTWRFEWHRRGAMTRRIDE